MISRTQEKHELANLNDRLAAYIDRVRHLESENSHLTRQVQTQEETVRRETSNIKALYEKEISDTRALLDETAKEKAKLQLEVAKYRGDCDEWRDKYERQSRDLADLKKRVLNAESQVNDLQARLNDALNQRKHYEDEHNKLVKDNDALAKQLASLKKQLEAETIKRVEAENNIQTLKEDIAFKTSVHEQELNETISRTRVEVEEVDSRIMADYDNRLVEALQEMRNQNEEMIRITREETEELFEKKMRDLGEIAKRNDDLASKSQEEIMVFRRRIADLNSELSKLRSQTASQEARITDLESQLNQECEDHKIDVNRRDSEIRRLRESLEEQLSEYRDLMDIKVQLDAEIMAYRKLLEGEETRLNLSQEVATPGKGGRRTPSRATPVSVVRKRKRMESGESSSLSAMSQVMQSTQKGGYSSTSTAKGNIEVYEVDTDGKYIKLFNSSDAKDQPVGAWQVKLSGGDEETTYKFHRSSKIGPGQYVTVWSSDQGVTHQPPADLVMKGQKWFTADSMKAIVINNQGEEVASRELERSQMRTSYTHSGYGQDMTDRGESQESDGSGSQSGRRSWFWWNK